MNDSNQELQSQVEAIANPLFDASQDFVRKAGAFLPHGAVLEVGGGVRHVMATPTSLDEPTSSIEMLPLLHDALRAEAKEHEVSAVAVCEDVTITPQGQKATKAVKVLIEHRGGFTVALYLPRKRKLLGGTAFGEIVPSRAAPEVRPWGDLAAG